MELDQVMATIRAQHDQNVMEARDWWKRESNDGKARLWDLLQIEYDDVGMELMSRLAAVAFERLAIEAADGPAQPLAALLTIPEIARRSKLVPRTLEGQALAKPVTARHVSSLLLDEAAAVRTHVREDSLFGAAGVHALVRTLCLAIELAGLVGVADLEREIDRRLPDVAENPGSSAA